MLFFETNCRQIKYFYPAVKFLEAENICESNNATLISIHSAKENEFIRNYIVEQPFSLTRVQIGLKTNIYNSSEIVWVDKSPVDYVNWNLGEPDNEGGLELCAQMWIYRNGVWNDIPDDNVCICLWFQL